MTIDPTSVQATDSTVSPLEEALAPLGTLDEIDVADHPAVFEAVHRVLRDRLAGNADVSA